MKTNIKTIAIALALVSTLGIAGCSITTGPAAGYSVTTGPAATDPAEEIVEVVEEPSFYDLCPDVYKLLELDKHPEAIYMERDNTETVFDEVWYDYCWAVAGVDLDEASSVLFNWFQDAGFTKIETKNSYGFCLYTEDEKWIAFVGILDDAGEEGVDTYIGIEVQDNPLYEEPEEDVNENIDE